MDQPADNSGGSGGASCPPVKDTRIVEWAIRKRWNIPEEARNQLPKEMLAILTNTDSKPRAKTAAARALIAAEAQNMEEEKRLSGGEVVNVNVTGEVTTNVCTITPDDIRAARHLMGLAGGDVLQNGRPKPVDSRPG